MSGISVFSVIALTLAGILAVIGVVQLVGPGFVREAYQRWNYSQRARIVTGVLDIAAALLLAAPATRGWGIALAGLVTFGSVVVLLNHRQYLYAGAAIGLMAALVPATLAVPRPPQVQFAVKSRPSAEQGLKLMTSDERTASAGSEASVTGTLDTRSF